MQEKEIEVKIATKEEALWIDFQKRVEQTIEGLRKELIINEAILEMCKYKSASAAGSTGYIG